MITIPKFIVIKVAHKLNRHHKILQINLSVFVCLLLNANPLLTFQTLSTSSLGAIFSKLSLWFLLNANILLTFQTLRTFRLGAIFSKLSLWFLLNANIILTFQTFSTGRLFAICSELNRSQAC